MRFLVMSLQVPSFSSFPFFLSDLSDSKQQKIDLKKKKESPKEEAKGLPKKGPKFAFRLSLKSEGDVSSFKDTIYQFAEEQMSLKKGASGDLNTTTAAAATTGLDDDSELGVLKKGSRVAIVRRSVKDIVKEKAKRKKKGVNGLTGGDTSSCEDVLVSPKSFNKALFVLLLIIFLVELSFFFVHHFFFLSFLSCFCLFFFFLFLSPFSRAGFEKNEQLRFVPLFCVKAFLV